jgi:hypothetical protein
VINGPHGSTVVPSKSSGGGGASIQTFKLRITEGDYLVCQEWDGTKEWSEMATAERSAYANEAAYNAATPYKGLSAGDVYILKPEDLRCGPTRKAWSEMSTTEKTNGGWANEAAYITAVGISYQSWGTSGGSPVWVSYYKLFTIDRSEPFMEYGTTVSGSHNRWREESDLYNAGEDLYHRRLSVIRHVYAAGAGVIERQRVGPVWLKGTTIYAAELESPITIPAKSAVAAVAEDGTITGEDEIPARAEIPERQVTHIAVALTSRWLRI